ncbi:MAG: DUF1549 domain-containing protein, partial [Planctomycetota bacterium]|nr:DUF1549 domain-containing protein [Planctomycetota bacterium]
MNNSFLLLALLAPAAVNLTAVSEDSLSFTRDIRPILSTNCLQCHGPDQDQREAGLRLDEASGIQKAFQAQDGEGLARILSEDEEQKMPPRDSHRELKPVEIEILRAWVQAGAQFESHWSFEAPQKSQPPAIAKPGLGWSKNEIDSFVYSRLLAQGLAPNPEADRERLIRRVTFDLIGLPPTLDEIEGFVNDQSKDAFEKVVDRLLASRSFGERMTLNWMDASRYGDTSVFHADGRRDMWAWRDWVINAYN